MIGVVCLSECVIDILCSYGVVVLFCVIFIGIDIEKFKCFDII